jgi:hypothetical protein
MAPRLARLTGPMAPSTLTATEMAFLREPPRNGADDAYVSWFPGT